MREPRNMLDTPKGDWRYYQAETDMHFREMHPRSLEAAVFAHRLQVPNLKLDVSGGWQARLWNDVCAQNEHLDCKDTENPGRWANLADVWNWAKSMEHWRRTGFDTVPQEEAERRAAICISCPHNKEVAGCFGCRGVGDVIDRLTGGLRVKEHDRLHQCAICHGCMLSPKVFLPLEVIETAPYKANLPSFCWLHKKPEGA